MSRLPSAQAAFGARGRTRPGRLVRLDGWLLRCERALLTRQDGPWRKAPVVDLGLGDEPVTTRELASALAEASSDVPVIGVDHDRERVSRARGLTPGLDLRQGGFELPLAKHEQARMVRAMNVLRGYPRAMHGPAVATMGRHLRVGGLLVEGTSCPEGHVLVAHLLRRAPGGLTREALLFSTDFAQGFAPNLLRDRLPRDLRRRVGQGEAMHGFFAEWTAAFERVRARGVRQPRALFVDSVRLLHDRVPGVDLAAGELERGNFRWVPPEGVPI